MVMEEDQDPIIEFNHADLLTFTNEFAENNIVGTGGFATVYRGQIPLNNRHNLKEQMIAVKVTRALDEPQRRRLQRQQFEREIEWLSTHRNHPNIIKMLGSFSDGDMHYIVIEFAEKGALTQHINELDWRNTRKILKGIARAIQYIHSFPERYIHCDIKTDNILLTENHVAKITDFGSIISENDLIGIDANNQVPTIGTTGYLDPLVGKRTAEFRRQGDDVYAFAIVLLQLIMKFETTMCRRPQDVEDMHIQFLARLVMQDEGTIVHQSFRSAGCGKGDGERISSMALELTYVPTQVNRARMMQQAGLEEASTAQIISDNEVVPHPPDDIQRPPIADVLATLEAIKIKLTPENFKSEVKNATRTVREAVSSKFEAFNCKVARD